MNPRLILLYSILFCASGCTHGWFGGSKKKTEAKKKQDEQERKQRELEEAEDEMVLGAVELKQARLWARLDELEQVVLRNRESIQLLEQGLTLGIVPEGLKNKSNNDTEDSTSAPRKRIMDRSQAQVPAEPPVPMPAAEKPSEPESNLEKEAYGKRLAKARSLFREGRYGKAYLDFSRLDREFPDSLTQGEPKYWLGRCWMMLKEHRSAKRFFETFLEQFAKSPWAASAKFFLAKTELELDLKELAAKHLQEVIRDHPYEGVAEASKQLLQQMRHTL